MIVYENAPEPVVRYEEQDLAGRRVAARAIPYGGEVGSPRWRFDPFHRRFVARAPEGSLSVGPFDAEAWRRALAKSPAGAAAVGPCDIAEEIRGAYRAAGEGSAQAGRGVYLLDPSSEALPEGPVEAFVPVFSMLPDCKPARGLDEALRRGFAAGFLLPLIPGWTTEPEAVERVVAAAAAAGARFVAGVVPADDGAARRAIIEARGELDRGEPEDFFERLHHADWSLAADQGRVRLREACVRHRVAPLPSRPVGLFEPAINAAAAARLEEKADTAWRRDEHHASLLHAAARWIDESGRDLAPILREGNFRKIFPFGEELALEAEEALAGC